MSLFKASSQTIPLHFYINKGILQSVTLWVTLLYTVSPRGAAHSFFPIPTRKIRDLNRAEAAGIAELSPESSRTYSLPFKKSLGPVAGYGVYTETTAPFWTAFVSRDWAGETMKTLSIGQLAKQVGVGKCIFCGANTSRIGRKGDTLKQRGGGRKDQPQPPFTAFLRCSFTLCWKSTSGSSASSMPALECAWDSGLETR